MSLYEELKERYGFTMTPGDVAEVLKCHASHVRAMCNDGELPAKEIGKRWFISTRKLAEIIEGDDV